MSSYARLYVRGVEVFSWRNLIEPTFFFLYTTDDIRRVPIDADEVWDESINESVHVTSSALVLADRLDALGIGKATVAREFDQCVRDGVVGGIAPSIEELFTVVPEWRDQFEAKIQFLKALTLPKWIDLLDAALATRRIKQTPESPDPRSVPYLLDIWGDQTDPRLLLRAILLACKPGEEITLDVTDLIGGGWIDEPFDPQRAAMDIFGAVLVNGRPPVVITEGSTDAQILQSTIRLRYPHLQSFIKFFDFTTDAEGSAAAGVRTLKSFAAAGISNRVVLLLDNDTAARDALRALKRVRLPDHYSVVRYPDLALARSYPTLGPGGLSNMDVNGLAGSIELYLGEDVLRDADGTLAPIQWRSYIEGVQAYQGEVLGKAKIQKRFEEKVRRARADGRSIADQDWNGLDSIIEKLLETLHG